MPWLLNSTDRSSAKGVAAGEDGPAGELSECTAGVAATVLPVALPALHAVILWGFGNLEPST